MEEVGKTKKKRGWLKWVLISILVFIVLCAAGLCAVIWGVRTSNPCGYGTIGEVPPPLGYKRCADNGFGAYLRSIPLKGRGEKVMLYTGEVANFQMLCYAVVDMPILSNAEQCADVCMRLRAEYLYSAGKTNNIHFMDVNGNRLNYKGGKSRKAFEKYLKNLYGVASTYSLSRELPRRKLSDMKIGDVFVYAAVDRKKINQKYGHAIMVVDMAEDKDGNKVFMLAEGNTPARNIHLMRNWRNPFLSPWFKLDEDADFLFLSPFYYNADELHRWE